MSAEISFLESEYRFRINRACDYIESNLTHNFTLGELASVASFSKFHFHRIFQAMVGETPFQFIQRIRLEKAATKLVYNPAVPVTEIAHLCGFNDLSVFSRNFKNHFNLSPSAYRESKKRNSNNNQTDSKTDQALHRTSMYICFETNTLKWRTTMKLNKSVEVKQLPKMTVAYLRHVGPYKGDEKLFENLWNRLFAWAGPRGLIGGADFKSLIIYHDDPNITSEGKLRTSVCISVPENTKVDGEVGKMEVEAGKYAVARFELTGQEFQQAWDWVYGDWFPKSGYQPDDKPCFEIYPEEPKDGRFTVEICVGVKPL